MILADRQLYTAGAAEYCFLAPFILWPDLNPMVGECCVAILTRIVDATTLHLDRNNVGWPVIVFATGVRVSIDAAHIWKIGSHRVN